MARFGRIVSSTGSETRENALSQVAINVDETDGVSATRCRHDNRELFFILWERLGKSACE